MVGCYPARFRRKLAIYMSGHPWLEDLRSWAESSTKRLGFPYGTPPKVNPRTSSSQKSTLAACLKLALLVMLTSKPVSASFNGDRRKALLLDYYGVRSHWLSNNTNCSLKIGFGTDEVPYTTPLCRSEPHWCPLERSSAPRHALLDAPPQLHGKLPCSLFESCNLLPHLTFYSSQGQHRLGKCLVNKSVVILGDSSVAELMLELVLLLTRDVPAFTEILVDLEWKFKSNLVQ